MDIVPEAICWYEGMPLLPQHFQMQSLRAELLAARYATASQPYYWGVTHFELDPIALTVGKIRITTLHAILPDGLLIQQDMSSGKILEFDCTLLPPEQKIGTINLYLAVPPLYRAGQITTIKERYVTANSAPVVDLASGEFPESLTIQYPAPRIVSEQERADLVCLPLLRVICHEGGYRQIPYIPPCPVVVIDSLLGRKISTLCCDIREKVIFLSGRLQMAKKAKNAEDIPILRRYLDGLLNRLPELEAAIECRVSHPLTLYHILCGMIGATACLGEGDTEGIIPFLSPFDYHDILGSFTPLFALLQRRLDAIRVEYRRYPFDAVDDGFSIHLPMRPEYQEELIVGLRMSDRNSAKEADTWLNSSIVASESHIRTLERQRMRGMTRQPLDSSEKMGYDTDPGVFLYSFQIRSPWFEKNQPLCIKSQEKGNTSPVEVLIYLRDDAYEL